MKNRIYLDNSATSFPKAPSICKAMNEYLENSCTNINRGETDSVFDNEKLIFDCRNKIARLYDQKDSECVFFTQNATMAINSMISGLLTENDHVLTSSFEHNAVIRPLFENNIDFTPIPFESDFSLDLDKAEKLIKKNTKAIIVAAASNVTGSSIDLKSLKLFAKENSLIILLDASQASPYIPLSLNEADGIAFTGHKGLLGPPGTGGMVLRKDIAKLMKPFIKGGTGSFSQSYLMPSFFPDKFEAGTQNIVGIIGLNVALDYISENIEEIRDKSLKITDYLIKGLKDIKEIQIINEYPTVPLVSVKSSVDVAQISNYIAEKYNIETRVGLLCAPLANKSIGTFPSGVLRLSPSHKTKTEEIDICIKALKEAINELL